ncbi:methyltransferase family protein [Methylocystis echinoides]|uniref:methyltransferase family protein n=1 Tax=Methylocystis echinoides TaxID=29468 RepID=UPI0024910E2F|nr:hypothetical protein [Methylocystis echinoides]
MARVKCPSTNSNGINRCERAGSRGRSARGAILFLLGTPLLLGSSYGLVFAPLLVILLAIRSVFEERVLAERFPEYAAYAEKVRFRFVPLVW